MLFQGGRRSNVTGQGQAQPVPCTTGERPGQGQAQPVPYDQAAGEQPGQGQAQPNRRQGKPGPSGSSSRWEVLKRVWRLGIEQPPLRASLIKCRAWPKGRCPVKPCTRVGT